MTAHIWNVGVVQNQQFPKRITLVANAARNTFYVIVTNVGGGPVKIIRGSEIVFTLPPNQSIGVGSDTDVHLELDEGPRTGATGNFSLVL